MHGKAQGHGSTSSETVTALLTVWHSILQVQPTAAGARNYSQCDSMLIGDTAAANTYPYIQVRKTGGFLHSCSAGVAYLQAH